MGITLRGLTWDHPRGYAPLIAGAPEYTKSHPEVAIRWDRRTLREFGEAPIEQYLDLYDLIVMDHPFVGFAAAHGVLVNLAAFLSAAESAVFARDSVGPSWESYRYAGALWALPIDAATQVASYRPDLLEQLSSRTPKTFDEVLSLGREARANHKFIIVPACPIDAISLFFSLTANTGPRHRGKCRSIRRIVGCGRSPRAPARAHRHRPSQIHRLEPDSGVRPHGRGIRRRLLPMGLRLFQLFAPWECCPVKIHKSSRCGRTWMRWNSTGRNRRGG